MAALPRAGAAAAGAGECPPGSVLVGVDELRAVSWRALKAFGHSDADATTLLDVRAATRDMRLRCSTRPPASEP
jgi:hypothetical protein